MVDGSVGKWLMVSWSVVGWSVVGWSVVGGSVVGGFNKTQYNFLGIYEIFNITNSANLDCRI